MVPTGDRQRQLRPSRRSGKAPPRMNRPSLACRPCSAGMSYQVTPHSPTPWAPSLRERNPPTLRPHATPPPPGTSGVGSPPRITDLQPPERAAVDPAEHAPTPPPSAHPGPSPCPWRAPDREAIRKRVGGGRGSAPAWAHLRWRSAPSGEAISACMPPSGPNPEPPNASRRTAPHGARGVRGVRGRCRMRCWGG